MALSTTLKQIANELLRPLNARVDSLTARRRELERLSALAARGYFDRAVFPLPLAMQNADPQPILEALPLFARRFASFGTPTANDTGYTFDNEYFSSPDAEVLYTMVRSREPRAIIEVGCGHSTRIARQAILDGRLATRLTCIDPSPRTEVTRFADRFLQSAVEDVAAQELVAGLQANDILFIDSSHRILPGSDVVYLMLVVLPGIAPGVLVHVHDVFLPWEYPLDWVVQESYAFDEQYLLQALLVGGQAFRVLWPGHYLQRTRADFAAHFPYLGARRAQSFWMERAS